MRIKDGIFCFAHLRWCHNGWASNILIMVDTGYAGIHHSKYWMPIHYDTIEDGQNKNLIFYSLSKENLVSKNHKFWGSSGEKWDFTHKKESFGDKIAIELYFFHKFGRKLLKLSYIFYFVIFEQTVPKYRVFG